MPHPYGQSIQIDYRMMMQVLVCPTEAVKMIAFAGWYFQLEVMMAEKVLKLKVM